MRGANVKRRRRRRRSQRLMGRITPVNTMRQTGGDAPFRDLNKNGRLDPYEDPRRPVEERVEDLLARMTLEEKAGLMFQTMAPLNMETGGPSGMTPASELIATHAMNHFNVFGGASPRRMADWHNS